MLRITLSKIRTWFWRHDYLNPTVKELDSLLDQSLHPRTDLDISTLSKSSQKQIKRVEGILIEEEKNRKKDISKYKNRKR